MGNYSLYNNPNGIEYSPPKKTVAKILAPKFQNVKKSKSSGSH